MNLRTLNQNYSTSRRGGQAVASAQKPIFQLCSRRLWKCHYPTSLMSQDLPEPEPEVLLVANTNESKPSSPFRQIPGHIDDHYSVRPLR